MKSAKICAICDSIQPSPHLLLSVRIRVNPWLNIPPKTSAVNPILKDMMGSNTTKNLSVALGKNHNPQAFRWRERMYRVSEVQECWRLIGAWWDGEGERTFFRVRTDSGGIYELCYDHEKGDWSLGGVRD